jgi:hypothetical protein
MSDTPPPESPEPVPSNAIPQVVLVKARRHLKRTIAAQIILAMRDEDSDFDQMSAKLGNHPADVSDHLLNLINCQTADLDALSDLCVGLGRVPSFNFVPAPTARTA